MTEDSDLERSMREKLLGNGGKRGRRVVEFTPSSRPERRPRPAAERRPGSVRFEYHRAVVGYLDELETIPIEDWQITKFDCGARVRFAEGRDPDELERILGELRAAGHRVEEFKLGIVEGPRR